MFRSTVMVLLVAAPVPALAATQVNYGFDTGTLAGWSTNSSTAGALSSYGAFAPMNGSFLGVVEAGLGESVYSTLTRSLSLRAGGTISGWFGFQAKDELPFNDEAFVAVNGFSLLSYDVAAVGDYGDSGWQSFTFTAPAAGRYTLTIGVANIADNSMMFSSAAVVDALAVTGVVPEPATWAMMIMGFGLVGMAARRRPHVTA